MDVLGEIEFGKWNFVHLEHNKKTSFRPTCKVSFVVNQQQGKISVKQVNFSDKKSFSEKKMLMYKVKVGGGMIGRISGLILTCEKKDALVLELSKTKSMFVKERTDFPKLNAFLSKS